MRLKLSLIAFLTFALSASVVIDRIAVIVGRHAIKSSDIERDLRVTQFLNHAKADFSADARRKAADRLVDQIVIRDEMERGAYPRSSAADLEAMMKRLLQDRFGGSLPRMREELSREGLTEEQLRLQLQWQLDVLKFLEERFHPGVLVSEEEVRSYYDGHRADLQRQFPQVKTYEGMEPKIRESLEGERLNTNFEQWLAQARTRNQITYRQEAF